MKREDIWVDKDVDETNKGDSIWQSMHIQLSLSTNEILVKNPIFFFASSKKLLLSWILIN